MAVCIERKIVPGKQLNMTLCLYLNHTCRVRAEDTHLPINTIQASTKENIKYRHSHPFSWYLSTEVIIIKDINTDTYLSIYLCPKMLLQRLKRPTHLAIYSFIFGILITCVIWLMFTQSTLHRWSLGRGIVNRNPKEWIPASSNDIKAITFLSPRAWALN